MRDTILKAYNDTKAYYCLDCGKCTSNCPVSRYQEGFSPRLLIKNATVGFDDDVINDPQLWDCLTCNICADGCMSGVEFANFIRVVRAEAVKAENLGVCSHGGMLQGLMRLMTIPDPDHTPDRLFWLNDKDDDDNNKDDLKVASQGDTLLFTGCLPIFQTMFENIEANSATILKAAIKIMNHVGIVPVVTEQERCCGHDLVWTGETGMFERLAQQNAKTFKKLHVKTIVTVCPEGYLTLKRDYPNILNRTSDTGSEKGENGWDFKVVHITEYLAELLKNGKLSFPEDNMFRDLTVTYHDPCRLGRFMGVYDAPRSLLTAIPGLNVNEMEHNRNRSLCCGVSSWTNCTSTSFSIRSERLQEAKSTGAKKLITSCPKCQIHFKCYTHNDKIEPQIKIDIEDITVFVAKALGLKI